MSKKRTKKTKQTTIYIYKENHISPMSGPSKWVWLTLPKITAVRKISYSGGHCQTQIITSRRVCDSFTLNVSSKQCLKDSFKHLWDVCKKEARDSFELKVQMIHLMTLNELKEHHCRVCVKGQEERMLVFLEQPYRIQTQTHSKRGRAGQEKQSGHLQIPIQQIHL